jgi:hypothetical protein
MKKKFLFFAVTSLLTIQNTVAAYDQCPHISYATETGNLASCPICAAEKQFNRPMEQSPRSETSATAFETARVYFPYLHLNSKRVTEAQLFQHMKMMLLGVSIQVASLFSLLLFKGPIIVQHARPAYRPVQNLLNVAHAA